MPDKGKKKVLITGALGFIGSVLCERLKTLHIVSGIDNGSKDLSSCKDYVLSSSDITDHENIAELVNNYRPDIIVHCAGIAHQKFGSIGPGEYLRVNSRASENLARAGINANPDVFFIFLSSISVYGEQKTNSPVSEDAKCAPSSDYAESKLDGEKRLIKLHRAGLLKKLDILRLAPVYDLQWSLNLDRRVFAPKKTAYLKFGSGAQTMSALARPNLVDFIEHRLSCVNKRADNNMFCNIFNVCDERAYEFNEMIEIFKKSSVQPSRIVLTVPLAFVRIALSFAGFMLKGKRQWLNSCYDKLALNLVFDNKKMIDTGFKPGHSLYSVFLQEI